jgi:hypothetical protein
MMSVLNGPRRSASGNHLSVSEREISAEAAAQGLAEMVCLICLAGVTEDIRIVRILH